MHHGQAFLSSVALSWIADPEFAIHDGLAFIQPLRLCGNQRGNARAGRRQISRATAVPLNFSRSQALFVILTALSNGIQAGQFAKGNVYGAEAELIEFVGCDKSSFFCCTKNSFSCCHQFK